jgi:hypothetical protein
MEFVATSLLVLALFLVGFFAGYLSAWAVIMNERNKEQGNE